MALTDSQSSKQSASIAENAAAEAKSYADMASKSEDYSNQAKESADQALESASNAIDANNSSIESSINAENSAEIAATAAANAVSSASVYPTLAVAQDAITSGAIPSGAIFSVASISSTSYVDQYKNESGTPKYLKSLSSELFVQQVEEIANDGKSLSIEVNGRTDGIISFSIIDNKLVFLAQNGAIFTLDDTGLMRIVELYGENVFANLLSLTGGNVSTSGFPLDIKASNGRVLILDESGKLTGIELDFNQIKLGGVDLYDLFGTVTPTDVKRLKIGFISGFIHFGFYGQSQVIGTTNGVIHLTPFDQNSLMLKGGLRSYGTPGYNTSVPESEYSSSLVEMHENASGETYCSGMAITARAYINSEYPDRDIKNIYTVNGAGGATVDMLKKGTQPYLRWVKQTVDLISLLNLMGEAYHCPAIGYSQGGSDDGLATDPDVWESSVDTLRNDFNADILSQANVKINPVWITNQINNYMRYPALNGKPNIGIRQYKIVTNGKGKYFGSCPTYICDFIDVAHWTKESQVKVGAYYEKTRRFILDEGYWEPVYPTSITTIEKFSTVQFNLPQEVPLQFNTEYVASATNYGFSAAQVDGTPIGIDRVRIVSNDTVEIRYTDLPRAGAVLMYGQTGQIGDPNAADGSGLGRTNGMRGNLCDTSGNNEKIYVSASEPEFPLHNWCWMFTESMGI